MKTAINRISDFIAPTPDESLLAEESSRRLAKLLQQNAKLSLHASAGKKNESIELPVAAFRLLSDILNEMAKGNAVTFIPVHAELTTQQAADFLNVSRPYLIDLLEQSKIPFHKVGTHRRVLFKDVMEYKKAIDKLRLETLESLAEIDQELGLG